jgi:hypothetical protein
VQPDPQRVNLVFQLTTASAQHGAWHTTTDPARRTLKHQPFPARVQQLLVPDVSHDTLPRKPSVSSRIRQAGGNPPNRCCLRSFKEPMQTPGSNPVPYRRPPLFANQT